ncbi:MAG: DUF3388 domain-containing protein [Firmicutes bacterium]|nr:DUF3388 domain-containing protein [Bacillota bacterium]
MLGINIRTVNSLGDQRRGFLLQGDEEQANQLLRALANFKAIEVTALRKPTFIDQIALRHGRIIPCEEGNPVVYRFLRTDLDLMIDFMAAYLGENGPVSIGLRGSPNVGKTEATIAACVYANKRWVVVSGTLFRQVLRTSLDQEERGGDVVLLIDAVTSMGRHLPEHRELVAEALKLPVPKVIEHPDIFVREGVMDYTDLDLIIEVRNRLEDEISYELIPLSCNSFDCS